MTTERKKFAWTRNRVIAAAESGEALLVEPLRSPFWGDARGLRQNIRAGAIVAEIARRTGLAPQDDGEVRGGGVFARLLAGSPE